MNVIARHCDRGKPSVSVDDASVRRISWLREVTKQLLARHVHRVDRRRRPSASERERERDASGSNAPGVGVDGTRMRFHDHWCVIFQMHEGERRRRKKRLAAVWVAKNCSPPYARMALGYSRRPPRGHAAYGVSTRSSALRSTTSCASFNVYGCITTSLEGRLRLVFTSIACDKARRTS